MSLLQALTPIESRVITSVTLDPEDGGTDCDGSPTEQSLRFVFKGGGAMTLYNRPSCCENLFMRTDDDLSYYAGATLVAVELRSGPTTGGDYDDTHEVQFIVVTTDKGAFTVASHNIHNGYYSGFDLCAEVTP